LNNLCVFLNGDRGLAVLGALGKAQHRVSCAVVPDDVNRNGVANHVRDHHGVPVLRAKNVNGQAFLERLAKFQPSLLLCAGFSTIFKSKLLELAPQGTINLHAGRLPQYRGGSPLNWQIINGEAFACISVIRMDEGIDTGEVLGEAELEIGPSDTIATLHDRTNDAFGRLVLQVLDDMDAGDLKVRIQDEDAARYWHQRSDADGRIDWSAMTAKQVHDFVRALTTPYPGAWSTCGAAHVRILETELPTLRISGNPGRICHIQGEGPYVVCSDYAVLVRRQHFEGNDGNKFVNGAVLD
jgi:methionyl-tRNA formyltransferase